MMEQWTLPEGWEWVHVAQVAIPTTQRNPSSEPNVPFQYVDIGAVDNQEFAIVPERVRTILGKDAPSRARKVIRHKNIIFATTRPYLKNIALVTEELDNQICSTGFCVLCPIEEKIDYRYLFRVLGTDVFIKQLLPKQRGANYPAVTDTDVFEAEIPIPYPDDPARSLAEQRRIVARLEAGLSEVRDMRALVEKMQRDLAAVMESALAEVFEQNAFTPIDLEKVVEIHDSGRVPIKESERKPGNIPYCGANGIIDYVDGFTHDGEFVLLAEDGGNFKAFEKSAYMMQGKFWANNHVHILRGMPGKLEAQYLYFVLYHADLTPYLTGATRPKLTQTAMRRIAIPVPCADDSARSLAEQQRIVARLEGIQQEVRAGRELLAQDEQRIAQLEQSILAAAFRGERPEG